MTTVDGTARVRIGHSELNVRPVGLGCMGMSQSYGPADDSTSIRTIRSALDLGVDHLDTSDVYGAADITWGVPIRGFGHNEELIGKAISGRRDDVVLATKFAARINETNDGIAIDGRPEYVTAACEASLRRLNTDVIDLYYYHRLDPRVPIEETVGAMAELVSAGKVRAIGLSEVGPQALRQAQAVHPIAALQSEYSLWERGVEGDIAETCAALGVTLVAYSPLGRSALTGALAADATFVKGDLRATNPRFTAENLGMNLAPVAALKALADQKGCRPGQLALAWLLSRPFKVVTIPGTKRIEYVAENLAATNVALSADESDYLSELFAPGTIVGDRYAPIHARTVVQS
ncbi:aldo/keto reductase [Mycolicibacterium smegmatis]|uniref:aldo/keto reductase n=1 Tax=Mycolicibacterium smegmatis TaxID=1772 RepID=UPI0013034FA0|nr:aldo/keto reductase [Mycolicibacterium smegmatis]